MIVVRCYKKYAIITSFGLVLLFFGTTAGQDLETTTSYWKPKNGDVRLVEGPSPNIGRVEVYLYGQWRTVCPTLWNKEDAIVVCRQLGYDGFAQSRLYGLASASYGYILIDNVVCTGSELTLLQCSSDHLYESDCPGSYYAGVRCENSVTTTSSPRVYNGDVKLVGGSTSNEGRVEIYYNGQWNTVCSDLWDSKDVTVVCRQLGYDGSVEAFGNAHFGSGEGDILLDNVVCSGYELSLLDCFSSNLYEHDCTHRDDAGVRCGVTTTSSPRVYNGDVKLVGGSTSNEGRVEIYYNGQWNTVCSDLWDSKDATVVCRQLGYDGSVEAFGNAHFGSGDGDILLDNVVCSGYEFSLLDCFSNNLYEHDCTHRDDAGVRCGDAKVNIGPVVSIVIGCVFALACVGVCLVVTYRHSKQNRASTQPRIAVISGRTNLTGPSAPQFNYNIFPPPPSYDEVMNNTLHGCQHAHSLNQGTVTTGHPTSSIPEFSSQHAHP